MLASLIGLSACRSVAPNIQTSPTATAERDAPLTVPVVLAPRDSARAKPTVALPTNDDVARAVVSVFGDTAALRPDSASASDVDPVWDIDVRSYETHERVAHYMRLFSTTGRERFVARLARGTRYDGMIRAKLRASGMPEDLTYLALIESGYDPHAYSKAAAVGMWQFMSSTARDVGMRVDWWVDERRDPVRATDGAIRFLGYLQKQFGSLYLAAAAYNGGPGRVSRGLTRFAEELEGAEGEDRFFALAEQGYLRAETKNYVPQLIAAALIAKMPARYGLVFDSAAPLAYDSVRVKAGTALSVVAAASGSTAAVMKDLNPSILRGVAPPDSDWWVNVPVGAAADAARMLDTLGASAASGYRVVTVQGSTTTPTTLATREGVNVKQLRWFNPQLKTTKKGRLVSGQAVRIPRTDALDFARDLPDPSIERYGGESGRVLTRSGFHVVKRGETLGAIAKRYGVSVARLRSLNGMRGTRVIAGQTLRVSSRATTRTSSKSSASKVTATKKAPAKKTTVKKATAKSTTAKKTTVKKPVAKKPATKAPTASKKPPARSRP